MEDILGQLASDIRRTIGTLSLVDITHLPKLVNAEGVFVYQALRRLDRENKLKYEQRANRTYVSLSDSEHKAYIDSISAISRSRD